MSLFFQTFSPVTHKICNIFFEKNLNSEKLFLLKKNNSISKSSKNVFFHEKKTS